jgi:hypothetical protein
MKTQSFRNRHWNLVILWSCLFLPALNTPAQEVFAEWLQAVGGTAPEMAIGAAEDFSTNVYILGRYYAFTNLIGQTTLTNVIGTSNIFVACLQQTSSGNPPIWALSPVTEYPISNARIGSTISGDNVIVAGSYRGTNLSFGNYAITNYSTAGDNSEDIFVAGIMGGYSGNVSWLIRAGGSGEDSLGDMVVDNTFSSSGFYITGSFQSSNFTAGSSNFVRQSTSGADCYTVKYDMNGNVLWAAQGAYAAGKCIATDGSGNCYVGGTVLGAANFGGLSPTNQTTANFFIKYDSTGKPLWVRGDMVVGNYINVDSGQNIYTVGTFSNILQIGGTTLSNNLPSTIFLAKYDNNGNALWARQLPGWGNDGANGITVDPFTNCWVTGYFASTNQGSLPTNSIAIIACYDPNGKLQTVAQTGGAMASAATAVADIPLGYGLPCVVGTFASDFTMEGLTITNSGISDIFVSPIILRPALALSTSGTNIVCSWPVNGNQGYQLQVLTNLSSGTWSSAGFPSMVNGQYVVTNVPTGKARFFRLMRSSP